MDAEAKLALLSTYLDDNVYELFTDYLSTRPSRRSTELINDFVTYINILHTPLNNGRLDETQKHLHYVYSHTCQMYVYGGAKHRILEWYLLLEYLTIHAVFNALEAEQTLEPCMSLSQSEYKTYKDRKIPTKISSRFSIKLSAEELFNHTLRISCPQPIAVRLKEHVYSFKEVKAHRSPLIAFLKQIHRANSEWYKYPKVIQGELLKFRGNLLENIHRQTAYGCFQKVKNSITVLIEHGLLPQDTELPSNLHRNSNTTQIRKHNPLIACVNLYDEELKQRYIDTPTFITDLKQELSRNLEILVREAQKIVYEGYRQFKAKDDVCNKSQLTQFITHPKQLVKCEQDDSKLRNPFDPTHPKRIANIAAYYDYYFEEAIQGTLPHKQTGLKVGESIVCQFGLTPRVASAMHLIIVEELGINPHSLYKAKVSDRGHGHEFVKVEKDGSVRIKTLKARAKRISSRTTQRSTTPLSKINLEDIDAAACLKMALTMSYRTRQLLGNEELWLCLTYNQKAGLPCNETFQNSFNLIRKKASLESQAIQYATLKKVRTTKGVLIYLESNGDSLIASKYLGNSVKTALKCYIPQYLSELIYRIKVRAFQNMFLFMAVATDEEPFYSLNMTEETFKTALNRAFENPEMGGRLLKSFSNGGKSSQRNTTKYFCVSHKNIELAIRYTQKGTDEQLKADCITALSMIAEGPVIMKQMLRKAQLSNDIR
ncbi:hypothetical protein OPW32_16720 [Vibrio europaeus]|uniref:hypothetical protein n=1 Tax=Vibrio europaeus TaxID=300876 RepID=UPI002340ABE9|nr:hypothetical protein [Vibrio europaeus]MDC5850840.1 hypothetical protein [Vibrio europaeus]